jgi:hypothetical protein
VTIARSTALEAEGGAVPLDSRFYISRPTDQEFRAAVARRDGIVLVKGPRQVGKTSLLARGLQTARETGARVVLLDFQTLGPRELESVDAFCLALGGILAEQLDLDDYPEDDWDDARGANANLTRYLAGPVMSAVEGPLVLGLDEVDRLFTTPFSDEIFAMFRGWHNRRALQPHQPWDRLTLAISFATEAHLFIRDLNQSPFNVGTRVTLRDFVYDEIAELNERYGRPLSTGEELSRLYALLGGHPFLTRKALNDLATGAVTLNALESRGDQTDGHFGDHLRRMVILLARDPEMQSELQAFLHDGRRLSDPSFHRLRSAGVLAGANPDEAVPRCALYGRYLRQNLTLPLSTG